MSNNNYMVTYPMFQIIDEIIHCDRKGIFKRIFLEAKVMELMVLQLEQFDHGKPAFQKSTRADIERLHAVKEHMINNLDNTSSLVDLAHMVGTNEFKLKKGFKELFGNTVFGFWNDVKMEQAREKLFEGNMNVTEISEMVGYKNARHFSTAFKKKYGMLPSQIKR